MSFGRWKLSAAVILLSVTASASEEAPAHFRDSLKCGRIAALSFADQAEPAAQIAKAAVESCRQIVTKAAESMRVNQAKKGVVVSKREAKDSFDDMLVEDITGFVIEMRGKAKHEGPGFYEEQAKLWSKW